MSRPFQIHHFVAIAGRAIDESTSRPVAGADAEIASGPAEFERRRAAMGPWVKAASRDDRVKTSADGIFCFLDLPDGTYELLVKAAGAPPANAVVTVNRSGRAVAPPSVVDVALQLTRLPDSPSPKPIKSRKIAGGRQRT